MEIKKEKELLAVLNGLIEHNKDGQLGYQSAAEHARNPELKKLFSRNAATRAAFADALKEFAAQENGKPGDKGTLAGTIHRTYMNIKSTLNGGDESLLEECESGDKLAETLYEEAIKKDLPNRIKAHLKSHLNDIHDSRGQIRALKNKLKRQKEEKNKRK